MDINEPINKQNQVNLTRRLYSRFHTAKVAKRITALVLVGTILTAVPACKTNDSNNSTDNPSYNHSQTNENKKPYSDLLDAVLNDSYYSECVAKAMNNADYRSSAVFDSHPYAFLESKGYDVSAIMDGIKECRTVSYVLDEEPNNLYMFVRVVEGEAYHSYLLKYELTNQEMKDYKTMHSFDNGGVRACHSKAPFLNDKISELKQPTIVGTLKAVKSVADTHEKEYKKKLKNHPNDYCDYAILNMNDNEKTFDFLLIPNISNTATSNKTIVDIDCKHRDLITKNGDVYTMGFYFDAIKQLEVSKHNAQIFDTQSYGFSKANELPKEYQQN